MGVAHRTRPGDCLDLRTLVHRERREKEKFRFEKPRGYEYPRRSPTLPGFSEAGFTEVASGADMVLNAVASVGLSKDPSDPSIPRYTSPEALKLPPIPDWYDQMNSQLQIGVSSSAPQLAGPANNDSYAQSASGNSAPVNQSHTALHQGSSSPVPFIGTLGRRMVTERGRRQNISKEVREILKEWFKAHQSSPYPREDEKQSLMRQTGLTMTQISNWFINARRRFLPRLLREGAAATELARIHQST